MRVAPSQVIPGCVLLNDVKGKSNRSIIPKNTVLTEEHITILQKFLIESVDVSSKLAEGEPFKPKSVQKTKENQEWVKQKKEKSTNELFIDHYQSVVTAYGEFFEKWQNGMAIDMPKVRKVLIPLLERINEIGAAIFSLNYNTTKEAYFIHHSVSVALLSAYIGKQMGYSKGEWLQIGLAGFLSDSGMAKIAPNIFRKSSPLTLEEKDEIKKHPTYTYRLVENISTVTQAVKLAVLQHHERIDGSGYPLGLSENKIHMYARIVAVCDMYHAMTSERFYSERQSPFKVIEELNKEQFTKLDPKVVNVFINSLVHFSIGTKVRLSNNQFGEIVFIDANKPTKPMIRIADSGEIIALQNNSALHIDEVIGG
ncbi:phosphohydrolase [Virgibacillus profundi]|uniref:Phosphohydrolase n=1 Tax=Virgibacillus profundi TaxID=2024555 RepID=A0A2A2IA95_9BACI|nr:HD-GYP domain-containing protein [Virgibacillus profundi]PAV28502.1 phosphohydrolase [Virgibacillus profundi]PXY52675.1 HD-GYP domain-containing protein [Virgibacillus profundi]